MQINYDELMGREPELAQGMTEAAEIDLAAPFALMMMALDQAQAKWDNGIFLGRTTSEDFLTELRTLVAAFQAEGDL